MASNLACSPGAALRGIGLAGILLAAVVCSSPTQPTARSIDGAYTLTLTTTCTAVPDALRTRSYPATVAGSPNGVVTLGGGRFWQHPTGGVLNRIQAATGRDSVKFSIAPVPGYGIIEQVQGGAFLEIFASGPADLMGGFRSGRRSIEATLQGTVRHGEDLRSNSRHVACQGESVSLRLDPATAAPAPVEVVPSVADAQIVGPASVAPGAFAAFTLTARMSDGSTRRLTDGVSWQSSGSDLRVDADGTVTGIRVGEAILRAMAARPNFGPLTIVREIIVVPDGTFRITGQVTEIGDPAPVPDARVEVVSGVGTGLSTKTDTFGRYRLYGVAGDAEFRITRDGYEPVVRRIGIDRHGIVNFELRLAAPRPDLSGMYTLTVRADACAGTPALREDLRQRTYTATLVQTGATAEVRLSGATFVTSGGRGDRFTGRVEPTVVTFRLNPWYYYYYYPDIAERLPDNTVLVIEGIVTVAITNGTLSGNLNGNLWHNDAGFRFLAGCFSRTHAFTMTRVN